MVVTWAKEEEGRIRERKKRVEENGSALEHAQEGLALRLDRILICSRKDVRFRDGCSTIRRQGSLCEALYSGRVSRRHHRVRGNWVMMNFPFD